MKTRMYLAIVAVVAQLAVGVQAAMVADPLVDKSLWYEGTAGPANHGILSDPLGPDDGWLVQDSSGWWAYATNGWNKIVSLEISYVIRSVYDDSFAYSFYGYDSTGNALPNPVRTFQSSISNDYWRWYTVTYSDLSSLNLRYVKIDGNTAPEHAWGLIAGTVRYETASMLGNLISVDTVDSMQNTNKWYDADALTKDWLIRPGNIKISNSGITGNPIGPDDGWDAIGHWNDNDYWASYKTVSGKFFGQVSVSFLYYMHSPAVVAYIQYWNGSDWITATPTASSGPINSSDPSWKWYSRSYDLTGLNADQIRVFGEGGESLPSIEPEDMTECYFKADLNCDGQVDIADLVLLSSQWLQYDPTMGWATRVGTVDMKVIP